jgi:hypothetical protein
MATPSSCPRPGRPFLDWRTGERLIPGCGTLACPYCGPRRALSTALAIVLARPTASGVVTLRGPPRATDAASVRSAYEEAAAGLRRIAWEMRHGGRCWEHVWVAELTEHLVPHVHVLARTDGADRDGFRRAARAAGLGWADLQPLRHPGRLGRYILKIPLAPLDQDVDDPVRLLRVHLALNGGRLVTATRRFWLDRRGEPARGLRMARVEARRARSTNTRSTKEPRIWRTGWRIPPEDDVPFV